MKIESMEQEKENAPSGIRYSKHLIVLCIHMINNFWVHGGVMLARAMEPTLGPYQTIDFAD